MAESNTLLEFENVCLYLDMLYSLTGLRLTAKKPRSVLYGFISNWTILIIVLGSTISPYMLLYEEITFHVKVQHVWAFLAITLAPIRFANRLAYWDEMQDLLKWFRSLHTRTNHAEYNDIVTENLKTTNNIMKSTMR